MELSPRFVERLIFGFGEQRRRTQDSPVLPDVWAFFATPSEERRRRLGLPLAEVPPEPTAGDGDKPLELLLTPHRAAGAARLAHELRFRLGRSRKGEARRRDGARIAYTHSYVVARLYFDEVVRVLLPLTDWWRKFVWTGMFEDADADEVEDRRLRDFLAGIDAGVLATALAAWSEPQVPADVPPEAARGTRPAGHATPGRQLSHDLLWMIRVVGTLAWGRQLGEAEAARRRVRTENGRIADFPRLPRRGRRAAAAGEPPRGAEERPIDHRRIVDAALELLDSELPVVHSRQPSLFLINRNRDVAISMKDSRRAIKADAATNLFEIRCEDLVWAVVDSGVDATHPAFARREEPASKAAPQPAAEDETDETPPPAKTELLKRSRVIKTYDFTRLRPLLDQEEMRELLEAPDLASHRALDPDLEPRLAPVRRLLAREDEVERVRETGGGRPAGRGPSRTFREQLGELQRRLEYGQEIDWELLDPLLAVAHDDDYPVPTSGHGTHVAGILAADWPEEGLTGVCRDIRLYDLRVLDPDGPNDEFTVLAALQFIQHLNRQQELLTVQGANLSLSIKHEVTNYACGRTPVCDECERLVGTGVVVVAAAGNAGWDDELARAAVGAGYRTVSITDPGNAEAVITVGATHRDRPHTYGVSFFSSRGPTGDGRSKPDLVAPGEKITSTVPGGRTRREDGTSMAAPHVSGAAALLMARHSELVGQPRRIKEVLCRTATDLGRERQFQGAGMLDVLRALQSL